MELDFPEREERQCVRKGGMISFAQTRTTPVILARGEVGGPASGEEASDNTEINISI